MQVQRLVAAVLGEQITNALRERGVAGEVRRVVRESNGELVLVVPREGAQQSSENELTDSLRRLVPGPHRVVFDGPGWAGRTEPLLAD